jgi:hypothetical protein
MKRKEGEMACPIDYKKYNETLIEEYRKHIKFEKICGCVVTAFMDGTSTQIKLCKKHALEVNKLKKEEGRRACEDRVLSIFLEN